MKPTVHILATVRKHKLLPAAMLIFRTLRIGFPTANVIVWGNALDANSATAIQSATISVGGTFHNIAAISHDQWIESLVLTLDEPFWVSDTDNVFWSDVEVWPIPLHFSGRYEPEFYERWMRTRHVARLHTSLMQFNPMPIRIAMRTWTCQIPEVWQQFAYFPFIRMQFIPVLNCYPLCYDTCAGLWQAGFGTPFTEEQNAMYEHLHCATYVDTIDGDLGIRLSELHSAIYSNIELAHGIHETQNQYYQACRLYE